NEPALPRHRTPISSHPLLHFIKRYRGGCTGHSCHVLLLLSFQSVHPSSTPGEARRGCSGSPASRLSRWALADRPTDQSSRMNPSSCQRVASARACSHPCSPLAHMDRFTLPGLGPLRLCL